MGKSKSALVVRGGWDGHQPIETTDEVARWLRAHDFDVRFADGPAIYADADYLPTVDLIVQNVTMSTIERPELAGLVAAVEAGAGFAGWHGGIADSYRNTSDYLHLVGGQFATHPANLPRAERTGEQSDNYRTHTIELTDAGRADPIMAGLDDFELTTEQYWVLTDSYSEVLATTTHPVQDEEPWHEPVTCPAVWKRRWGAGRVFVATPGHRLEVLQHPSVRTIVERGLLWASR